MTPKQAEALKSSIEVMAVRWREFGQQFDEIGRAAQNLHNELMRTDPAYRKAWRRMRRRQLLRLVLPWLSKRYVFD